ncbi:MAG: DNA translocase FtsK [Spirochaetales bacterium]|nr:DNA translocase FtsK [Spirochaetales bacterium]
MDKVTGSSLAHFIQQNMGRFPGGIMLFLLFIAELFLIYLYAGKTSGTLPSAADPGTEDSLLYSEVNENSRDKREFVLKMHRMHKTKKEKLLLAEEYAQHIQNEPQQLKANSGNNPMITGIKLALPLSDNRKKKQPLPSLPQPQHKETLETSSPLKEEINISSLIRESELKDVEDVEIIDDVDDVEDVEIIDSVDGVDSIGEFDEIDDDVDEFDDAKDEAEGDVHETDEEFAAFDAALDEVDNSQNKNTIDDEDDPFKVKSSLSPQDNTTKKTGKMRKPGGPYSVPVDGILSEYEDSQYWTIDDHTRSSGQVLMETLKEFKIEAEVTGIRKGPVITMFEILPAPGVKLSKIVNLADNIALRLAASRVRIVAPIPGKHAVGIEVPNKKRAIVSFKEMVLLDAFKTKKYKIPIIIGKDIAGEAQIIDLVQTPHLLIAGATGSGKSVCVNAIICSILYRRPPEDVKLILIDPKIVELKFYNDIPHLLTPVVTTPQKAFQALQYCICEMERRYSLLDALGVRDIESFNKKIVNKKLTVSKIPYIVIIIDEFADLIANTGKEMEQTIARLAAMSRAVGLHLVLATQRPSVEVITGLIKANIPSRIAFMVASKFDSRIIIDAVGAEKLLGKGDMLLTTAWDPFPMRIQGSYVSEIEVEALVEYLKTLGEPDYIDDEIFLEEENDDDIEFGGTDPLMDQALEIVVAKGKASASFLQRRLKIGYNRAARIVEEMEMRGIVGPPNGSKPRDILHIPDRK